ncbi:MAG: undecaprenyl-diphosphate phosphatase, partial [Armatimonadota bacterium]|nr:undecaprenyl-diphosphate phosphatase [Armatimonadota bacterium]
MVILGLVQGLTEFLPVSSTAHLIFAQAFLGITRPGILLEAVLHLGTALAALVLFWADVRRLLAGWWASLGGRACDDEVRRYGRLAWLIVAITAITAAVGLALADPFERMFGSLRGTAFQLVLTGAILF